MNNPFDYTPTEGCEKAFRELTVRIDALRMSVNPDDVNFIASLDAGKMLGVLIAEDDFGNRHILYAFSGQLGDSGFRYHGFVEPVLDYLDPAGYFKKKEAEIAVLNTTICKFEREELRKAGEEYQMAKSESERVLNEFREKCRQSKHERDMRRSAGEVGEEESREMIRRSQYEKAEFKRLKRRMESLIEPELNKFREAEALLVDMKDQRRKASENLQRWLFDNFRVLNWRGESRSLSDIFSGTPMGVPPSGAGECCAPKLLQATYQRGWQPLELAEYWYGKGKAGEVRIAGRHYPACRGKCLPILRWMLQGVEVYPPLDEEREWAATGEPEIVYENEWFCVVDKPSGMLSVPGKGEVMSVERWLKERFEGERWIKMVHRLDQDTSGLLIAAYDEATFKEMQKMFATRRVKKTYEAILSGDYETLGKTRSGEIELPIMPDWLDRPRQKVDYDRGKDAVTSYEFVGVENGRSRVVFHPVTGRTHQLRVHSASISGLGMPIEGDRLYGVGEESKAGRLCLHAREIEFMFPKDGRHYRFESAVPF